MNLDDSSIHNSELTVQRKRRKHKNTTKKYDDQIFQSNQLFRTLHKVGTHAAS
jgi:hypothetical protein